MTRWTACAHLGEFPFDAATVKQQWPRLHRGDLAIVRKADTYGRGDAVLYASEQLGAKVLHRIERVEGDLPRGPGHVPSRPPGPKRAPRAQAIASMRALPSGCTSTSSTGPTT